MNGRAPATPLRTTAAFAALLLLAACASAPGERQAADLSIFRDRLQTQQANGIVVEAGVPSAEETLGIFGKDLYKNKIQPVWISIKNDRDLPVHFLPVGLDPEYYPPLEVANLGKGENAPVGSLVDRFFMDQSMDLRVLPGQRVGGFIFSRLDEGTKAFNVDVYSENGFQTFTFFIPVPGLDIDHYDIDWDNLYPADQHVELSAEQLIEELEGYACCVTDKKGQSTGDPLNLVIIGTPQDVYTAFIRAGWDETETVTRASAWKTVKSFLSGGEYRYSPVSSLYVFGRPQDVAFQRARENIHERNHLRLWMSPATHQGIPVWIGQISRDIGVRFTTKTVTTHKIDPDVDETREFLLEDLAYAQSLQKFGYVAGVGAVSSDAPRGNLTGDPWFTDGYRLVLWLSSRPLPLSALELLDWRHPHPQ